MENNQGICIPEYMYIQLAYYKLLWLIDAEQLFK
jgi:hypothetical protein